MEVTFEGITYTINGNEVFKGDKKVGNPDRVKQVLESIVPIPAPIQVELEPVEESPKIIKSKPKKK